MYFALCSLSSQAVQNIESEISSDPNEAARSAALWLWGMHNRVNVRLAPQWNLSPAAVLYPSIEVCPTAVIMPHFAQPRLVLRMWSSPAVDTFPCRFPRRRVRSAGVGQHKAANMRRKKGCGTKTKCTHSLFAHTAVATRISAQTGRGRHPSPSSVSAAVTLMFGVIPTPGLMPPARIIPVLPSLLIQGTPRPQQTLFRFFKRSPRLLSSF